MSRTRREILGLPPSATAAEVEAADLRMAAQIRASERLVSRGGQFNSQINKEMMMMNDAYGASAYPYLEAEDAAFSRCFRLSEDDFLKMAGNLRNYTQFRLDRSKARGASIKAGEEVTNFDIPPLPSNTEEAMAKIQLEEVKPEDFANYLLSEQIKQVKGVMSALKADKEFKAMAANEAAEKESARAAELRKLAARNPYRWPADSQSAKDFALGEYQRRHRR